MATIDSRSRLTKERIVLLIHTWYPCPKEGFLLVAKLRLATTSSAILRFVALNLEVLPTAEKKFNERGASGANQASESDRDRHRHQRAFLRQRELGAQPLGDFLCDEL